MRPSANPLAESRQRRKAFVTVSRMRSQILGKGSGMAGFRSISPGSDRPRGESALAEIGRQAAALDLGAPVSIRVSPRARRVGLRIDAAERRVELVLPRGVPAELGLRFLKDKRGWIAARLGALPGAVPFVEGAIVPVMDVPHRICRSLELLGAAGGGWGRRNPRARRSAAYSAPGPRPSCGARP